MRGDKLKSNNILKYIIYRLLLIVPTAILLFIASFILARLMAGDIAAVVYAGQQVDASVLDAWREVHGFNDPILTQLWRAFKDFLSGDLGTSYVVYKDVEVREILAYSIPRTLELVFIPTIIVPIIGVKLGVIAAKYKNKAADTFVRGLAVFGVSFPVYWVGLGLQYIFGFKLRSFTNSEYTMSVFGYKTGGFGDPEFVTGFRIIDCILGNNMDLLWDSVFHLVLPVTCMILVSLAGLTRITRSSMLDVLEMDYIRTARAKGCLEKTVINQHALRNAMIPSSTAIVMNIAYAISGSFLIEVTFSYKAMGYAFVRSLVTSDYYLLQACMMLFGIILLVGYLVADVLYTIIDPRISYSK